MRHTKRWAAACLIAILALAGCARFFYLSPAETFKHDAHNNILDERGYQCLDCHRFTRIDVRDINKALKASDTVLYPGKPMCHNCHVDIETRVGKSPSQCRICHIDMRAIMPESHMRDWQRVHAIEVKQDRERCNQCHRENFCTDCHIRRDVVQTVMHPRIYRTFHFIEAQIDPARCSSCHTASYCISCHRDIRRR